MQSKKNNLTYALLLVNGTKVSREVEVSTKKFTLVDSKMKYVP